MTGECLSGADGDAGGEPGPCRGQGVNNSASEMPLSVDTPHMAMPRPLDIADHKVSPYSKMFRRNETNLYRTDKKEIIKPKASLETWSSLGIP